MLTIKQINTVPDIIPQVKALYQRAFPRRERIPFFLLTREDSSTSETFAFFDENNSFVGFACLLTAIGITHITYLAVEESERDHGYGSQILELIRKEKTDNRIIVDIETPEEGAKNEDQRLRRKSFYLRCGYRETDVGYHWREEDYEILSIGGNVTEEEFDQFWDEIGV